MCDKLSWCNRRYYSRLVNNVHYKVYKYEKQVELMKKKRHVSSIVITTNNNLRERSLDQNVKFVC